MDAPSKEKLTARVNFIGLSAKDQVSKLRKVYGGLPESELSGLAAGRGQAAALAVLGGAAPLVSRTRRGGTVLGKLSHRRHRDPAAT